MIRTKLVCLLTLIVFTTSLITTSAQNLGVHPTTLDFKLSPGQSESQSVHLSNSSGKKVQFRLYLNDWIRDTVGGHAYFRADTLPQSCASWITLDKNFVELDTNKSTDVTIKLAVPDAPGAGDEMKWAMLFIETVEEQVNSSAKGAQAAVRNLLRIGVHIYQTPPTVTQKGVKVFDITRVPNTANTYQMLCQNTGKVMIECRAYLELNSLTDGKKTKMDDIEFPLFPGQRRYVPFELPKDFPKGKYSALAVLDAGEDVSLEAVESEIEVK